MRMSRIAVGLLVAVSFFVAVAAVQATDAPADRPNILFIYCDDCAYQALSAYGSVLHETPNIDRIADEGMVFTNSTVTNSICGPCRAVIQTGKYSHLNGFIRNGNRFDGSQQTFPKLLQKAGYQTAVVGKWHLATDPQGYDYSEVLIGQGPYYNPPMKLNGEQTSHIGYTTEVITDLALRWLEEDRDTDKPFMLMYQHKAPHRRWEPGPSYLGMYDDTVFPEPATLFDDYAGLTRAAKEQDMTISLTMTANDLKLGGAPGNLTPDQKEAWNACYDKRIADFVERFGDVNRENLHGTDPELVSWKYQMYMRDYLACVAGVDVGVGRVLDYFEENNLTENTVIIFSSDQGFYLGEHGWFDKRFIYNESLKTPLIVSWPGVVEPGTTNDDIVSNVDMAETFLDIADAPIPSDMQGASIVPLLAGETPEDWRETVYYHYYEFPGAHSVKRHYGVYDGRYKLTRFYYNVDEWELIDLENDPLELTDVYADPANAEVVERLTAELNRLREELEVTEEELPQR
jgi:arylsulfatase A-like enzyme